MLNCIDISDINIEWQTYNIFIIFQQESKLCQFFKLFIHQLSVSPFLMACNHNLWSAPQLYMSIFYPLQVHLNNFEVYFGFSSHPIFRI